MILGWTALPAASACVQRAFGGDVTLVFSADETAREVVETLRGRASRTSRTAKALTASSRPGSRSSSARSARASCSCRSATLRRVGRRAGGGGMSRGSTRLTKSGGAGGRRRSGTPSRNDGRRPDQLRPVIADPEFLEQPHGVVLWSQDRRAFCAPPRRRTAFRGGCTARPWLDDRGSPRCSRDRPVSAPIARPWVESRAGARSRSSG